MVNLTTLKLPNEPMFKGLVWLAENEPEPAIFDSRYGVEADIVQLLADVHQVRQLLYETLPEGLFDTQGRICKEKPFIGVLIPTSYDFIVAAVAILAVGGAIMPLGLNLLCEESSELLNRCSATGIVTNMEHHYRALQMQEHGRSHNKHWPIIPITTIYGSPAQRKNINIRPEVDPAMTITPNTPSAIIFTSGTSGPPKGVVHVRRLFNYTTLRTEPKTSLCYQPAHWVSGFLLLICRPLCGHRLVISNSSWGDLWEALRKGGIHGFWGVPTTWEKMKTYFDENIKPQGPEMVQEYLRGIESLETIRVTGAFATPEVKNFWKDLFGRPMESGYSTTELGGMGISCVPDTNHEIERCIGEPQPDVTVKLSDGDSGELLVKTPPIFSHYLNDPVATEAAFDSDGYFRTGEFVRQVGTQYVLDVIRTKGHRISILEVESQLIALPYVSEGYVLEAADRDGDRVAALIRLRPDVLKSPSVRQLRIDLHRTLYAFQLPTALRFLRDGEDVPRTDTGKLIRRRAAQTYFAPREDYSYPDEVETCDWHEEVGDGVKAWDWGGRPY
ncbi:uncharacterized protein ATNIH1004_001780 [Aspergillus tanneri]|uniref:AMP-dependent synthetase/ligase domain-containing protein n=1 Tax=Aspergillus tanneri TaxID=1220188 RepID=A0A5M9N0E3_9EURO|nr:uncharacterized protein ATNIH1004_001780 [Aspergillus tanneri]KAA8652871.1 hypothetical protein ATNIH1004_001780 [Aspergillus tanneri]